VIRLVSVDRFSLPLSTPLDTAAGRIEERRGFLVRITDGEHDGIGEATPLLGWTESESACLSVLEEVTAVSDGELDGIDAPAARHGLSLALADLRARREGVPLAEWFGASPGIDEVATNATIGDHTAEEVTGRALDAVADGFGTVKLKVGARPVTEDADRVSAVRGAIGDGVALRLDANGAWDRETARRALAALAEFDPEYVEQPLAATDLDGIEGLDAAVPIALDESLGRSDVERCLDVADVLVCKPMVLGGPDRVREIHDRARARETEVVLTTTIDGAVARLGALALAASVAPGIAHGLATAGFLAGDLGDDRTPVEEGSIRLPSGPGLGIEWGELRV